jgi:serine-type D-Ala-D-Ala carboxypeptidase (penicillin-binding protein 5/6)
MNNIHARILTFAAALILIAGAPCPAAELPGRSADPYLGAIVVDAATGDVLFEQNADAQGYPASMIKLMDLLVILEKIEQGSLNLQDQVTVTAEAANIGGSQVYLKEKEVFPIDDLLYAMIVQSANDAATALAIHIGGTKDGFTEMMNQKAQELGLKSTVFHSVHGLPPGPGQEPDVSTPRDLAILCRELVKRPEALRYTSTRERGFRNDTFMMRTHNPLLGSLEGCDGLKTGYFAKGGFSLAATAERKGMRVIAVVLGSADKKTRNAKAAEIVAKGFLELAKKQVQEKKTAAAPVSPQPPAK